MLKALEVENFKAFGRRARIPLAPITLIFGENSSGKSSIIQALNLLKQTIEGRDPTALLLPRAENGTVDLGSFQDAIFDHDLSRKLKICLKFHVDSFIMPPRRSALRKLETNIMGMEFCFKRPSIEEEVQLESIKLSIRDNDEHVATYTIHNSDSSAHRKVFPRIGPTRQYRAPRSPSRTASCQWVTENESFWEPFFQTSKQHRSSILELFERIHGLPRKVDEIVDGHVYSEERLSKKSRDKDAELLSRMVSLFSKDFSIREYMEFGQSLEKLPSIGLDSFLPVAGEMTQFTDLLLRPMMMDPGPQDAVFPNVAGLVTYAGRALESLLVGMFPLGPFRRPPERWYIFSGTSPKDVGYRGDQLPDLLYRNRRLLENANEWLARLNIGYRLKIESLGERNKDLFEVRLVDTRRSGNGDIEVGLSDVGFGISQLLPFLVQALASRGRTISIEQPEVHIHPKLQADLGDLLADCIQERRANQFIIETHSEHLVLRIQRLVRTKTIKPEDVSILYVMRGDEGSRVISLPLDEDGDFIEDWPGGFFPERLRELE